MTSDYIMPVDDEVTLLVRNVKAAEEKLATAWGAYRRQSEAIMTNTMLTPPFTPYTESLGPLRITGVDTDWPAALSDVIRARQVLGDYVYLILKNIA